MLTTRLAENKQSYWRTMITQAEIDELDLEHARIRLAQYQERSASLAQDIAQLEASRAQVKTTIDRLNDRITELTKP